MYVCAARLSKSCVVLLAPKCSLPYLLLMFFGILKLSALYGLIEWFNNDSKYSWKCYTSPASRYPFLIDLNKEPPERG